MQFEGSTNLRISLGAHGLETHLMHNARCLSQTIIRHRSEANDVLAKLRSEGILNLILEEEALNEHRSTRVNAVK